MDDIKQAAERHQALQEKAGQLGEMFKGSYFEPGDRAVDSAADYNRTVEDKAHGIFQGKGFDESDAQDMNEKFEAFARDAEEARARMDMDQAPEQGVDER